MTAPIKVIIADDSPTFREGIKSCLEQLDDFRIVGQVNNGRRLLSVLNEVDFDAVLMDIKMPEKDGIECTQYIRKRFPKIKVLIISNYGELVFIRELINGQTGAHGYLLKNVEKEEIVFALKKVMTGKQYLCDEIRDKMNTLNEFEDLFSPQELKTLYYFWNGLTAEQIAKKVFRSKHAVDARFKSIYAKTGCDKQRELMRYIVEQGLSNLFKYMPDDVE